MNLNSILQNFTHIWNMKPQKLSSHQSVFVSAATSLNPWDRLSSSLISKEAVQPHLFPFSITDFGWNQRVKGSNSENDVQWMQINPTKNCWWSDGMRQTKSLNGFVPSVMLIMNSFAGWWKRDTTSMSENKIRTWSEKSWEVRRNRVQIRCYCTLV